jgi:hypothetical protein
MVDFENWPECDCGVRYMKVKGYWESKTGTRIMLYQCSECKEIKVVLTGEEDQETRHDLRAKTLVELEAKIEAANNILRYIEKDPNLFKCWKTEFQQLQEVLQVPRKEEAKTNES